MGITLFLPCVGTYLPFCTDLLQGEILLEMREGSITVSPIKGLKLKMTTN